MDLTSNGSGRDHVDGAAFKVTRVDLAPGRSASVLLGAPGACAAAGSSNHTVRTAVSMAAPGGGNVTVNGAHVDLTCGAAKVLIFRTGDLALPESGPFAQLTASIQTPNPAVRGQWLTYTIVVSNPSSSAVALQPCPSYTESIFTNGVAASHTFLLNCGSIQIAAGGSVTFEMRIPVPAGASTGGAKLGWQLDVANGAAAGTAIAIN